jgi:uncharacterized protein (DUF1499 family)
VILVVVLIAVAGVVVLALFSVLSRRPNNLGVVDGRLAPCPPTPNCVCTQATDEEHRIEPFRYEGDPAEALARLKKVVASQPRVQVVTENDTYLHAEFTSLLFRYVDDVEFLLDRDAKVIHFRSASRAGRSDFGVNRGRMEAIRQAFAGQRP